MWNQAVVFVGQGSQWMGQFKMGRCQGAGWDSRAEMAAGTGELTPDPRASGRAQGSVSEEVRRKRCQSWDWVQLPDKAMNQLPLSYDGGEINNNNKTLTITGVFYSQLVAVRVFFAGCFDRKWPCTSHTLVMLSNDASRFIPGWSSV